MKWFLWFIAALLAHAAGGKPPSDEGRLLIVLASVFLVGGSVVHSVDKLKDKP